jgi:hypothetical protein
MFLGLPDPVPLVRGIDPDPSSENSKKNLDSYCFLASFGLFIFEKLCKFTFKSNKQKKKLFFKLVFCWRLVGQGRK